MDAHALRRQGWTITAIAMNGGRVRNGRWPQWCGAFPKVRVGVPVDVSNVLKIGAHTNYTRVFSQVSTKEWKPQRPGGSTL